MRRGTLVAGEALAEFVRSMQVPPPVMVRVIAGNPPVVHNVVASSDTPCPELRKLVHDIFGVPDTVLTELRMMPGNVILEEGYTLLSSWVIDAHPAHLTLAEASVADGALLQLFFT